MCCGNPDNIVFDQVEEIDDVCLNEDAQTARATSKTVHDQEAADPAPVASITSMRSYSFEDEDELQAVDDVHYDSSTNKSSTRRFATSCDSGRQSPPLAPQSIVTVTTVSMNTDYEESNSKCPTEITSHLQSLFGPAKTSLMPPTAAASPSRSATSSSSSRNHYCKEKIVHKSKHTKSKQRPGEICCDSDREAYRFLLRMKPCNYMGEEEEGNITTRLPALADDEDDDDNDEPEMQSHSTPYVSNRRLVFR
jgi:hypothetical protein